MPSEFTPVDEINPKVISPLGEEVPASLSALISFEEPPPSVPTMMPGAFGTAMTGVPMMYP